ncbi:phosphoglycolate phosphatase [Curvibacter sp. PAE-UM]|uniref:phosphoglycolate phosphatase n=1 Tax=Curvibacter sp. PAE-UM TaxID=1714344 RepID=UPI0007106E7B|nr:phosphoglycolate phosphatase [Curvibacter sp. PAE-UM]KRH99065.1 phosphoglycolate phosphatase [Curvibacter sp. PAE-UM]
MNKQVDTPFDLVMFDLDGTLIETAPEICDAVNDTLQHFGLAQVQQDQVDRWIGHGTRELLVQALAQVRRLTVDEVRRCDDLPLIAAEFDRHYQRRCGTRSHLYPHVREVLKSLRAQGIHLAVVTNKEARYTRTVLAAHALEPLFDRVVSGDTLPTKKPDPAGIRSCLAQFQVDAARALFVGDSSIDVASARNAGVPVWALPYGYNMGQPIEACGPDRVIPDFRQLLN